jgi:hypothetical protein
MDSRRRSVKQPRIFGRLRERSFDPSLDTWTLRRRTASQQFARRDLRKLVSPCSGEYLHARILPSLGWAGFQISSPFS